MKKPLVLVIFIVVCQAAGLLGSVFTYPAIKTWYVQLRKPSFTPPDWLFGPAWITLYFLMAVAAYLVWHQGQEGREIRLAMIIFGLQLLLNILWSWLFFGLRFPQLALIEIVILWFFILLTILNFLKFSKPAALLLLPYLFWVSFAAVLNFSIFRLN